jgi:hypothetical protein
VSIRERRGVVYPFALEVTEASETYSQFGTAVEGFVDESGRSAKSRGYRTLREWREFFGGDEGKLVDIWGDKHTVSLRSYSNSDPDLLLLVGWREFLPHEQGSLPAQGGTFVGKAP